MTEALRSLPADAEKAADELPSAAVYSPVTAQEDRTEPNQAATIRADRAPQTCAVTEPERSAPLPVNAQDVRLSEPPTGQQNLPFRGVPTESVQIAGMPWHPDRLRVHGQRPGLQAAAGSTEQARDRRRNRECRHITASNSAMPREVVR